MSSTAMKIEPAHLERRAVVYLRQSTLKQLHQNQESTRRQYGLRDRATELGWIAERVDLIDSDLGRSGATTDGRTGFKDLAQRIADGKVGIVLALEVSRLARSSADWHRLVDLCGLADVLIGDEHGVYDARDPNDRLLLGLKGTLSEAELSWMRLRLQGARRSKARRGSMFTVPPTGYLWDSASERFRLDPDEQVQGALRLVFERFRVEGSAYGVVRYLISHGVRLPSRNRRLDVLNWVRPRPSRILAILHNPTYAGAYVYGRRKAQVRMKEGRVLRKNIRLAPDEWEICLPDHHPAYLSWSEYLENLQTLESNRVNRGRQDRGGAPREGSALLQGLVMCGRCGHRMHTAYNGGSPHGRYVCASTIQRGLSTNICWSASALRVDKVVVAAFLDAVQPDEIELSLGVALEVQQQASAVDNQWRAAIERAQYEAQLAERRYKAVDPDNRVVARTLEREWNDKLLELERLDDQRTAARDRRALVLTEDERRAMLQMASDLPELWAAPTTTVQERKNLLRLLIDEIALVPIDIPEPGTRIRVQWHTGVVSDFQVRRGPHRGPRIGSDIAGAIQDAVATGTRAGDIAKALNEAGHLRATGTPWTKASIHSWCRQHGVKWPFRMPTSLPMPNQRADGLYSMRGVADELGVTRYIVAYWVAEGWLDSEEGGGRGKRRWFRLDAETRERLSQIMENGLGPRSMTRSATTCREET